MCATTKKIAIFDFDDTLFFTPKPNDKYKYFFKKMKLWPHQTWWNQKESLDDSIFTIAPNYKIIKQLYNEKLNNSILILLTGRCKKLEKNIIAILKKYNIDFFDFYYLNDEKTLDMTFKINIIVELSKKYPHYTVEMWDDKEEYHEIYLNYLKNNFIKSKLNLVGL